MVARHGRSSFGPGITGPSSSAASGRGSELRLDWRGRTWEPGQLARPAHVPAAVTVETIGVGRRSPLGPQGTPPGRLVLGDALDVARALADEGGPRADLVYIDPPFASQTAYVYEGRLDGPADGRVLRARAYDDRWNGGGMGTYLDMLAPRLEALAHLLAPTGTIWVHVDYRASYLVRLLLDELLGREAFVNEIVWRRAPNLGRQAASSQFGRTLDTIVVYGASAHAVLVPPTRLEPVPPGAVRWDDAGRPFTAAPRGDYTDASIDRLDKEGRVHRTASGKAYVKYFLVPNADGVWCRDRRVDALWTDVRPLRHATPGERTGFPTQKPRTLLDRIVACASPPGGLVVDLFAGSGTTGESAQALGRRFVVGDASPLAIATARARLLRAGAPLMVQECGGSFPSADAPTIAAERIESRVRVRLLEPPEPLAWAVGVLDPASGSDHPHESLETVWHSERAPGMRARPALREAVIERTSGPLAVRVWSDEGRVGAHVVEVA
jgi:DNA modification methylase